MTIPATEGFETITLGQLERASLQSRVEQKYILPQSLIGELLSGLTDSYNMLAIEGRSQFRYYTRYFDTPDLRFYLDHHNGAANRMKVRYRMYEDSQECFFEIKHKRQETLTEKTRFPAMLKYKLDVQERAKVTHNDVPVAELVYKLSNRFQRITLCSKTFSERLTIDTGIHLFTEHSSVHLHGVAVVERKIGRNEVVQPIPVLKPYLATAGFSKYAVGVAKLYPGVKHNNFKPVLLNIEKYAHQ